MEEKINELEENKKTNEEKQDEIKKIEESEIIYGILGGDSEETEPKVD